MTASYHEHYNAAHSRARRVGYFVVFGFAVGLSGCSISMPMTGLIDESPSDSIASKAVDGASTAAAPRKTAVEIAAVQTGL